MYLGIDLGNKRCGIAVYVEGVIIPKSIILRTKLITEIKKNIIDYNIKTIVVGLPYDLYGKELKQLEKSKKFIEKLKIYFPSINIEGFDERYTSFEAERTLSEIGIRDKQGKKDAISASIILEEYLQAIN